MKKLSVSICFLVLILIVPDVYAELTNLSLNSETTATANQVDAVNNNFASNAIDGDLGTLWRATSHGTLTDPKYLIVDLGGIYEVDHIVLWGHDTLYVNYYIEYNLYTGADGINFDFLSTGRLITPPSNTPPDEYYDFFRDTVDLPTELRLMRFAKFEVIGGQHDAHLNEIEIWGEQTTVSIDIIPKTCPNECPIKGGGSVEVAILGTVDLDVNDIDIASVRLEGVAPARSSLKDKSAPAISPSDVCDCTTEGRDGLIDLCLKFDKKEILSVLGGVNVGDSFVLTLTGSLKNGTPVEGQDCIVFVKKGKKD